MVILGIRVTLACGLGAGVSGVIFSVKDLFETLYRRILIFGYSNQITTSSPRIRPHASQPVKLDKMVIPKERVSTLAAYVR